MTPDRAHRLMRVITDFLSAWIDLQMKTFPTIDGIFMLDDIIGFIGDTEFRTFGLPYFKELYNKDVSVKFLHNDAPCRVSAPYLPEIGVNLFNMGFEVNLNELKEVTGNRVTMLGNIPPRDVLASATPDEVEQATRALVESLDDPSRVIFSCGGGMPPGVSSENVQAFLRGLK
jgi:uroporphyrinogen decarboxylase